MRYEKGSLLDKKFKAISNNTRRKILMLLKENPLNAGEIANHFTFSFTLDRKHKSKLDIWENQWSGSLAAPLIFAIP